MSDMIINTRKQMESDALEITPDQQVKLPELAIVLFTRLVENQRGVRTTLEGLEHLDAALPTLELPQWVGLWIGMRKLYLTYSELLEALRKYGKIHQAESDAILSQARSSVGQSIVEAQTMWVRVAELNEKMRDQMSTLQTSMKAGVEVTAAGH
jgi:hypothetical protein